MRLIAASALLLAATSACAETTAYECKFLVYASPDGLTSQDPPLEIRYVADSLTNKAYAIGNTGSAEVKIIPNSSGISFIETTNSGNVMVTSIIASGEAVHSRNFLMFKELVPSQSYGKCTKQ